MFVKFRSIYTAAFFCASIMSFDASAQDLRGAVVYALENHPAVEGAYLGYKAAEEGKDIEFSNYFPEISVNATAGSVYQDNSTSRGLSVTRGAAYTALGEANISMRQMLFDGFETKNRVGAADARMQSMDYSLMDMESQITIRVAQSYIEALRIRSALSSLVKQIDVIEDYKERIADMVSEGVADESELQQARDVVMIMDGMRADYEGQLAVAEAQYVEAAGGALPEGSEVPQSLSEYIGSDIGEAIIVAQKNHPVLLGARMDSKAARHDMKAEKAHLYPDFDGELSYLKTDKDDIVGGESTDARAVFRMTWDFSIGGKQISSIRKKRYEHQVARANYETLEREIERDIRQVYASYVTVKQKVDLARDRVDLNERLLEAYKVQFEGARISLLSLMRAESQLFNARLELSDNEYYLLAAEYMILASLGELQDILMSDSAEKSEIALNGE